jgi:ketosteroid isomerase-like protein
MIPDPDAGAERRTAVTRFFAAIQAGDYPVLLELLTPDAVTRWPQSGERLSGAMACVRVYENYPGGSPDYLLERVSGDGDVWVAELIGDYGTERWHLVSVVEFQGSQIARMTDYFGPSLPAPAWRQEWVEREPAVTAAS